jgi:hypothetical protein
VEAGMQLRLITIDGRTLAVQTARGNIETMNGKQFAGGVYII